MMLQLRFAPRFSAAIRAGQKVQTFRLGAPRAEPGSPIQLIESGSGRLLLNSWILEVQPATIRRCVSCEGKPQISGIQLNGRQLEITRDAAANGSRPEQHLVIDAQDIAVLKPIPERRRPNREHD